MSGVDLSVLGVPIATDEDAAAIRDGDVLRAEDAAAAVLANSHPRAVLFAEVDEFAEAMLSGSVEGENRPSGSTTAGSMGEKRPTDSAGILDAREDESVALLFQLVVRREAPRPRREQQQRQARAGHLAASSFDGPDHAARAQSGS